MELKFLSVLIYFHGCVFHVITVKFIPNKGRETYNNLLKPYLW